MADVPLPRTQTEAPQYSDDEMLEAAPRPIIATPRSTARVAAPTVEGERKKSLIATLDIPLILVVSVLLGIGAMMVYSTTFYWSTLEWDSDSYMLGLHLRNMGVGAIALGLMLLIDYRIWKRFTVWMLLAAISFLIGVLLFGDRTFGARRALIAGSYQPGELAELVVVIYLAAWLGSKGTKVSSFFYGLLPFTLIVGVVGGLVVAQPDLSTALIIFISAGIMFFLAGADLRQLLAGAVIVLAVGIFVLQNLLPIYAQERVDSFQASITDLTQANWHTQQAVIAFMNGGWFGRGLGQGLQKFRALPAPHTDSIFAVIGEELGVLGAGFVVALYVAFAIRGFRIARRALDPFGALLAAGITIWVVTQALLNIAVMTALVPSSGMPLPYISYGGTSMVVLMAGAGLLMSIHRVSVRDSGTPERRQDATAYRSRGDGRARVPRAGRR
ncbi:MAG: FtsW/RodA/SpoVE family cell cycle protein [Chloroflexi bacterium]|nr:FtsW/RodA/SpoVE family cell cycle protein [Chloroflexota bacterium]